MKQKNKKRDNAEKTSSTKPATAEPVDRSWIKMYISIAVGISIAIYIGAHYGSYIKLLHENHMWFSNIKVNILQFFVLYTVCIYIYISTCS